MRSITSILPYHPRSIAKKLNEFYFTQFGMNNYNTEGEDIFKEDWDNLFILDACRYDLFESNAISGKLESRTSRGSATWEFLKGNCSDRDLRDVVYVTANPVYYYHRDSINAVFHDVIHVWQEDGWDEEMKTVLPETTTKYARDAYEKYPNKRLVIHYIQPHYPFIGSGTTFDKKQLHEESEKDYSFWHDLTTGDLDISWTQLWELYEDNLNRVLPHVEQLLNEFKGRTVVTADHGNMFGERASPIPTRFYGHPPHLYTEPLVKVPWLIRDSGPRKEITVGETTCREIEVDEQTVGQRLQDLGYVDM